MSGRAGRRGKDDRGIVIQMLDEKMDPQVAKGTCPGMPCPRCVCLVLVTTRHGAEIGKAKPDLSLTLAGRGPHSR